MYKRDYAAIMAKYPTTMSVRKIARAEGLHCSTLWRNVKMRHLRPTKKRPRTIHGTKKEMLASLLDAINLLRRQDLTGPEVCGELTDLIVEALEKHGG